MKSSKIGAQVYTLQNDLASVDVFSTGASLHNYVYKGVFKPFAEADWQTEYLDSIDDATPRHLQLIGGEWPCVPFGTTKNDPAHHGYGSDHNWCVKHQTSDSIVLTIEYPEDHKISHLARSIRLNSVTGDLEISLEITASENCCMPIGIHPIFKLPEEVNSLHIIPPSFVSGASAPTEIMPKTNTLGPAVNITKDASFWNSANTLGEELVQVWQTNGKLELQYRGEGYSAFMSWNVEDLPHCLFWIASPGLTECSLGDGFTGIGVEPTNSFFDANDLAILNRDFHKMNPLTFGVEFSAHKTWRTDYKIGCRKV